MSVRSGARASMPGMMETVLNCGLTKDNPRLVRKTDNPRFVYDAYRRLMTMYADVVMEKAAGIELTNDGTVYAISSTRALKDMKTKKGYMSDIDLLSLTSGSFVKSTR